MDLQDQEIFLNSTSLIPRWLLFDTSDSEDPKRYQRGSNEEAKRRFRGETVARTRFWRCPSHHFRNTVKFLDDLEAFGYRFALLFSPKLYIR